MTMIEQVCGPPKATKTKVSFPCGLSLPEVLLDGLSAGQVDSFNVVHQRHHLSGHPDGAWSIVVILSDDGTEFHQCGHEEVE